MQHGRSQAENSRNFSSFETNELAESALSARSPVTPVTDTQLQTSKSACPAQQRELHECRGTIDKLKSNVIMRVKRVLIRTFMPKTDPYWALYAYNIWSCLLSCI